MTIQHSYVLHLRHQPLSYSSRKSETQQMFTFPSCLCCPRSTHHLCRATVIWMRPGLSTEDDLFSAGQATAPQSGQVTSAGLTTGTNIVPAEGPSSLDAQHARQASPSPLRKRSRIHLPYPLTILALLDVGYSVYTAREEQHIPTPLVTFTVARAVVLVLVVGCSRRWKYRGGWVGMVCAMSVGAAVWEACRGILMRRVIPPERGDNAAKGSFLAIVGASGHLAGQANRVQTAAIASLEYVNRWPRQEPVLRTLADFQLMFLLLIRLSPPVRQSDGTSLRLPTSRDPHLFHSASTRSRRSENGSYPSPARSRRGFPGGSAPSTPARMRPSKQQRRASAASWLAEQAVHNSQAAGESPGLLSPGLAGPSRCQPDQVYPRGDTGHSDRFSAAHFNPSTPTAPMQPHGDVATGYSAHSSEDAAEGADVTSGEPVSASDDDEDQFSDCGSSDGDEDDDDDTDSEDDDGDSASSVSESSIIDLPPPLQPSRIVPPSLSMNGGLSSLANRSPILRPLVRRSRSARFLSRSWGSRAGGAEYDDGDVEARAEGYGTFRQR